MCLAEQHAACHRIQHHGRELGGGGGIGCRCCAGGQAHHSQQGVGVEVPAVLEKGWVGCDLLWLPTSRRHACKQATQPLRRCSPASARTLDRPPWSALELEAAVAQHTGGAGHSLPGAVRCHRQDALAAARGRQHRRPALLHLARLCWGQGLFVLRSTVGRRALPTPTMRDACRCSVFVLAPQPLAMPLHSPAKPRPWMLPAASSTRQKLRLGRAAWKADRASAVSGTTLAAPLAPAGTSTYACWSAVPSCSG